ncbi:MAG: M55 family metallopeptidase [Ignavibacteria bacterium]|nr:M55 family metallopeptidase [Ignavibacteria bacterium]
MKVFIIVDMEGATGVVHPDQLMPDARGYAEAQKLLTADVNAAIEGVLEVDGGATFLVADGHGPMRNVLLKDLNNAAELVIGGANAFNKPLCQVEGIDDSFDIAFMIGFHSKAGTPSGVLAHTYVGSLIRNLRLNSRTVGEAEMNAAVLADFNVPVALIVGNSDLEPEVREWNTTCEFVSTKSTLGPTAAICKTPGTTQALIRNAAKTAAEKFIAEPKASAPNTASIYSVYRLTSPVVIEVDTYRREQAQRLAQRESVTLVSDSTITITAATSTEAFKTMWSSIAQALQEIPNWLT